jgi:vacuolar protein-sorting-associated protein 4
MLYLTTVLRRLVKALFSMARENKPSVIFIDEIDALCGPRGEGESEASRRIKTEILVQMDGVGNDSKGILVLGATNIPWQLDAAIRRRFQRRVHIGLPDVNGRARMFKLAIGDTDTALVASDYNILASKSDGMSGSDIANVVQSALMRPVRKILQATHFKAVSLTCFYKFGFPLTTLGYERWQAHVDALLARRPRKD